jgi:hypothetical protein
MITWLNETENSTARGRVVKLIQLFQSAREVGKALGAERRGSHSWSRQRIGLAVEYASLQERANRLLRGHVSYAYVSMSQESIHIGRAAVVRRKDRADSHWPINEFAAVEVVLRLVEEGRLWKVKVCRCGLWFFAPFSHKQFHAESCKQQEHRSSEEYKKYRRAYQRRLYKLHKEQQTK